MSTESMVWRATRVMPRMTIDFCSTKMVSKYSLLSFGSWQYLGSKAGKRLDREGRVYLRPGTRLRIVGWSLLPINAISVRNRHRAVLRVTRNRSASVVISWEPELDKCPVRLRLFLFEGMKRIVYVVMSNDKTARRDSDSWKRVSNVDSTPGRYANAATRGRQVKMTWSWYQSPRQRKIGYLEVLRYNGHFARHSSFLAH